MLAIVVGFGVPGWAPVGITGCGRSASRILSAGSISNKSAAALIKRPGDIADGVINLFRITGADND